jgi:hypothetical protein
MSYNDYNGGGGHGARDEYYSDNRRDDGYGRSEGRYNDTRYDDTAQNRYSSQNDDYSGALSHAQQHDNDSDKNSSFFSQALFLPEPEQG